MVEAILIGLFGVAGVVVGYVLVKRHDIDEGPQEGPQGFIDDRYTTAQLAERAKRRRQGRGARLRG